MIEFGIEFSSNEYDNEGDPYRWLCFRRQLCAHRTEFYARHPNGDFALERNASCSFVSSACADYQTTRMARVVGHSRNEGSIVKCCPRYDLKLRRTVRQILTPLLASPLTVLLPSLSGVRQRGRDRLKDFCMRKCRYCACAASSGS